MSSETNIDIHRTSHTKLRVDINGRKMDFLYNPETEYVLVPAGVYASETKIIEKFREADMVEGIFNHESITEL